MLTYQDRLALSPLRQKYITAIAGRKHMPEIVALELGCALYEMPEGKRQISVHENAEDALRQPLRLSVSPR